MPRVGEDAPVPERARARLAAAVVHGDDAAAIEDLYDALEEVVRALATAQPCGISKERAAAAAEVEAV
jgi:hypothetical protein